MSAMRSFIAGAAAIVTSTWAIAASPEPPPGASSCTGCHASTTAVDTAVPRLAGRKVADIVAAMRAFKSGEKPSTVMDRIAKGLTDAEVDAIAAWYTQQK